MKKVTMIALLASLPLLSAAGIPNFFAGLIGDNVHTYCEKTPDEQTQLLQSVNRYTGNHKVVVVCGEITTTAKSEKPRSRSGRIAR